VSLVILETAIALAFLFALFSLLASLIAEGISSFLALRAGYLLRGLRSLFDGDEETTSPTQTNWLLEQNLVRNQGARGLLPENAGNARRAIRRSMPSYIAGRTVARSIMATLVPNADGSTSLSDFRSAAEALPAGPFTDSLLVLIANADGQVAQLRRQIEEWYDDHMKRVSGWYKRRLRIVIFAVGVVLVLIFNANAVNIARALYTDQVLRESVVTLAVQEADCSAVDAADCLQQIRGSLGTLGASGVPLFWAADPYCEAEDARCSVFERFRLTDRTTTEWSADLRHFGLVVLGWLAFALALVPGANFWFDLLTRLGGFRSSGARPDGDDT
jgi:hypothetical protein